MLGIWEVGKIGVILQWKSRIRRDEFMDNITEKFLRLTRISHLSGRIVYALVIIMLI